MKAGVTHRGNGSTNFHGHKLRGAKDPIIGWSGFAKVEVGISWRNRQEVVEGVKQGGDWFNASQPSMSRLYGSKSPQRKMASAMIAKIPLPLSRHIAAVYAARGSGQ
jgi:hypothetical protein